jgi:hypothetical protein
MTAESMQQRGLAADSSVGKIYARQSTENIPE